MQQFFEFSQGTRIIFGSGLVSEIANEISGFGSSRVFIITDEGVIRAGLAEIITRALRGAVEVVGVFDQVPPNSSMQTCERCTEQVRAAQADLILTIGGGSPIDTAKAVRVLLTQGGTLRDYEGYNLIGPTNMPLVAIPTAAGTGSEVTSFTVIYDESEGRKLSLHDSNLAPDLAVLDPEMTRTLPMRLTAATGLDALSHAVEAYVATNASPFSDSLALYSIDMISNHLRAATHSGDDMHARSQMLIASTMAGVAFDNSWVGVVHALAHAVGARFPVHHGTLNAILLPHGMAYNSEVIPSRYSRIARALGVNAGGRSEAEVISDGISAVSRLASDCNLPTRLREVGVTENSLESLAELAMGDGANYNNPRNPTQEELLQILKAAW